MRGNAVALPGPPMPPTGMPRMPPMACSTVTAPRVFCPHSFFSFFSRSCGRRCEEGEVTPFFIRSWLQQRQQPHAGISCCLPLHLFPDCLNAAALLPSPLPALPTCSPGIFAATAAFRSVAKVRTPAWKCNEKPGGLEPFSQGAKLGGCPSASLPPPPAAPEPKTPSASTALGGLLAANLREQNCLRHPLAAGCSPATLAAAAWRRSASRLLSGHLHNQTRAVTDDRREGASGEGRKEPTGMIVAAVLRHAIRY